MDSINTLRQNKQPESGCTELICQTFGIKKWIYLNSRSPTFAAERAPLPKSNVIAPLYPSVLNAAEMYLLNVEKKSAPTPPPDTCTNLYNIRQSMRRTEPREAGSRGHFRS